MIIKTNRKNKKKGNKDKGYFARKQLVAYLGLTVVAIVFLVPLIFLFKFAVVVHRINNLDVDVLQGHVEDGLDSLYGAYHNKLELAEEDGTAYYKELLNSYDCREPLQIDVNETRQKIIIYGGSSVGCSRIGADFVDYVNDGPHGEKYVAYNFALAAQTSGNAVGIARDMIPLLKPQAFVLYAGHNDFMTVYLTTITEKYLDVADDVPFMMSYFRFLTRRKIEKNFAFRYEEVTSKEEMERIVDSYITFDNKPRIIAKLSSLGIINRDKILEINEMYREEVLNNYLQNIKEIKAICDDNNVTFILATVLKNLDYEPTDYMKYDMNIYYDTNMIALNQDRTKFEKLMRLYDIDNRSLYLNYVIGKRLIDQNLSSAYMYLNYASNNDNFGGKGSGMNVRSELNDLIRENSGQYVLVDLEKKFFAEQFNASNFGDNLHPQDQFAKQIALELYDFTMDSIGYKTQDNVDFIIV